MVIRTLLCLMAALFISASAFAADKGGRTGRVAAAVQDPVAPAVLAPSWTGFYVGLNGEYTMQTTETIGGLFSFDANDISYGITAGYDHKLPGTMIVVGVMGDFMWQRNESVQATFDRSWFLGGRAGMLFSPTVLVYGLAGHTEMSGSLTAASLDSGLTLGAGIEAYVTKNLSAKLEWRRTDLGDTDGGLTSSMQDGVRAGLSWRFDSDKLFGN